MQKYQMYQIVNIIFLLTAPITLGCVCTATSVPICLVPEFVLANLDLHVL